MQLFAQPLHRLLQPLQVHKRVLFAAGVLGVRLLRIGDKDGLHRREDLFEHRSVVAITAAGAVLHRRGGRIQTAGRIATGPHRKGVGAGNWRPRGQLIHPARHIHRIHDHVLKFQLIQCVAHPAFAAAVLRFANQHDHAPASLVGPSQHAGRFHHRVVQTRRIAARPQFTQGLFHLGEVVGEVLRQLQSMVESEHSYFALLARHHRLNHRTDPRNRGQHFFGLRAVLDHDHHRYRNEAHVHFELLRLVVIEELKVGGG